MYYKKRIIAKVDNSFIIWFKESNKWILFEEPAYYIYKLHNKGLEIPEILTRFQKKYNLPALESRNFISDIINEIKKSSTISDYYDPISPNKSVLSGYVPNVVNSHSYRINQKIINIEFESDLLGFFIHPLFSHLEAEKNCTPDSCLELFMINDKFVLGYKNHSELTWIFKDINQLKKKLFVEISNIVYNKKEKSWMTLIHASAITDKNQTVLLSSVSGGGKSTLAALLMKHGLELVSDDFVLLGSESMKAYPFPAAISLKGSSINLFQPDQLNELQYKGLKNESVKYLPPVIKGGPWYYPHPVRKIIFVKYNPKGVSDFSKLPVLNALKLFFDHAKISTRYDNAKSFINWFIETESYRLEYFDKDWAEEKILKLFHN